MVDSRIDPRLKLYKDLNSKLSISEEHSIRNLIIGDQIQKRELDRLGDVTDIFISLQGKGYFESDLNLIKELLKQIYRQPLIKKVDECERELKLFISRKSKKEKTDGDGGDEIDATPRQRKQGRKTTKGGDGDGGDEIDATPRQRKQGRKTTKGGDENSGDEPGGTPPVRAHAHQRTKERDETSGDEHDEHAHQRTTKRGVCSAKNCICLAIVLGILSIPIGIYIKGGHLKTSEDKMPSHLAASGEKRLQPSGDYKLPSGNNKLPTVKDGNGRNKRSVLFLNDEWGTSKGGISSVNRQLALQARDAGYAVYVTVLDPPSDEDKKDAEDNGINLIKAETIPGVDQNINLKMLNNAHQWLFSSPEKNMANLDVIIGHVPITSEGALNIMHERFPKAKVYLFTHVIPQDTDFHRGRSYKLGDIETKVDTIIQQAEQADLIFSVGPKVYREFKNEFRGSKVNDDKHKEFIPMPDSNFFDMNLKPFAKGDVFEILTVGRVSNVENLKGYNIVAAALGKVATKSKDLFKDSLRWRIRGISEKDKDQSLAYIQQELKSVNGKFLDIYPLEYGTQEQVRSDIKKSRLFLMPSLTEPFGMVGLEAMAAGIPILVTANSGLADFLEEHFPKHMCDSMIVSKLGKTNIDKPGDIAIWEKRITDVLFNKYNHTFNLAKEVKDKLIEMKSHQNCKIFKDELEKL